MRALNKSKRVSWPSDLKLCQVRLFLSEESPSQVRSGSQEHLQTKSPWPLHPSDQKLPPGFARDHSADYSQINVLDIPVIKWKRSVQILVDVDWRVVAGDESKEVDAQNQRELRCLEAFYPGASAIPPNPAVSDDVQNSEYDDRLTSIVPVWPVEDDDIVTDSSSLDQISIDVNGTQQPSKPTKITSPTPPPPVLPAGSDLIAALSEISRTKEQGNVIDQGLLLKILSDPKLVENLVASCGTNTVSSSSYDANGVEPVAPASSNGQFYPQPNGTNVSAGGYPPNYGVVQTRDPSYYKSLIQQHGGERQEPTPVTHHNHNPKPRHKIMKPCMYYNSARGCRHGDNCSFLHDASLYQPRPHNNASGLQNPKRTRFD